MSGITSQSNFNEASPYFISTTGTSVAGVLSLKGQAGVLNIVSTDNSITSAGSPGSINLSTTGNPLAPSTIVASGAISGASVSTAGAVSAGSVASSGAITAPSVALTGSLTSQFNNSAVVVQTGNADGPVLPLTALTTFLANRDASRSCFIMVNVSGGTPFVNGNPFCQAMIAVPPRNGATGDVGAIIYGAQDGLTLTIQPSGPQLARVMTINVQNLSGATQDYTYSYTVFGA
jgi:hypothetical protein